MRTILVLLVSLLAFAPAAHAVSPSEQLSDPAQENRARELSKELRCMVCQNQSIDDSDAPLARDLRVLVRERITAGDNDAQVIDYLVSRYGQFVLLRPRFDVGTAILWFSPALVLFAGAVGVFVALRRRRVQVEAPPAALSAKEEKRLAALLRDDG